MIPTNYHRPDSVFAVWTQFGKKTKTFFDLKCTVTVLSSFIVQRIEIIWITGLNRNNVEAKKRSWKWYRKMFSYWKISTMIDLWLERWNLLQTSTCPWATQTWFKLEKYFENQKFIKNYWQLRRLVVSKSIWNADYVFKCDLNGGILLLQWTHWKLLNKISHLFRTFGNNVSIKQNFWRKFDSNHEIKPNFSKKLGRRLTLRNEIWIWTCICWMIRLWKAMSKFYK